MKQRKTIIFTEKEAIAIKECLETLAAMSGTYDNGFTKCCQNAGNYAKKIGNIIYKK